MSNVNEKSLSAIRRIAIALQNNDINVQLTDDTYHAIINYEYVYIIPIASGNICELFLPVNLHVNDKFNILDYAEKYDFNNLRLMFGHTRFNLEKQEIVLIKNFLELNKLEYLQLPAASLMEIEMKFASFIMSARSKELESTI